MSKVISETDFNSLNKGTNCIEVTNYNFNNFIIEIVFWEYSNLIKHINRNSAGVWKIKGFNYE